MQSKESKLENRILEIIEMSRESLEEFKDLMPIEAKSVERRMKGFRQAPAKFAPFLAIPEVTLKKLCKLYPHHEFLASLMFILKTWSELWSKNLQKSVEKNES